MRLLSTHRMHAYYSSYLPPELEPALRARSPRHRRRGCAGISIPRIGDLSPDPYTSKRSFDGTPRPKSKDDPIEVASRCHTHGSTQGPSKLKPFTPEA